MLSFPAGERVEKLRRYMADQGVDICLLSSPENMEYFSGFQAITYTRPIRLVVSETETHLIVPALEEVTRTWIPQWRTRSMCIMSIRQKRRNALGPFRS